MVAAVICLIAVIVSGSSSARPTVGDRPAGAPYDHWESIRVMEQLAGEVLVALPAGLTASSRTWGQGDHPCQSRDGSNVFPGWVEPYVIYRFSLEEVADASVRDEYLQLIGGRLDELGMDTLVEEEDAAEAWWTVHASRDDGLDIRYYWTGDDVGLMVRTGCVRSEGEIEYLPPHIPVAPAHDGPRRYL